MYEKQLGKCAQKWKLKNVKFTFWLNMDYIYYTWKFLKTVTFKGKNILLLYNIVKTRHLASKIKQIVWLGD